MFGNETEETAVEKRKALSTEDAPLSPLVPEGLADLDARCVDWVCRGGLSKVE